MAGTLYILSAPSGAGKTSLVTKLIEADAALRTSISHTTRTKRNEETDGVNYHFISIEAFSDMAGKKAFLEQAEVFGNHYGTNEEWVNTQLNAGTDVILEIDWQGARQIRKRNPEAVFIFILPPTKETLRNRLHRRGQDNEQIISKRMAQATEEMSHFSEYDYIVINDQFDKALNELQSIVTAQRLTINKQQKSQALLLNELIR